MSAATGNACDAVVSPESRVLKRKAEDEETNFVGLKEHIEETIRYICNPEQPDELAPGIWKLAVTPHTVVSVVTLSSAVADCPSQNALDFAVDYLHDGAQHSTFKAKVNRVIGEARRADERNCPSAAAHMLQAFFAAAAGLDDVRYEDDVDEQLSPSKKVFLESKGKLWGKTVQLHPTVVGYIAASKGLRSPDAMEKLPINLDRMAKMLPLIDAGKGSALKPLTSIWKIEAVDMREASPSTITYFPVLQPHK